LYQYVDSLTFVGKTVKLLKDRQNFSNFLKLMKPPSPL